MAYDHEVSAHQKQLLSGKTSEDEQFKKLDGDFAAHSSPMNVSDHGRGHGDMESSDAIIAFDGDERCQSESPLSAVACDFNSIPNILNVGLTLYDQLDLLLSADTNSFVTTACRGCSRVKLARPIPDVIQSKLERFGVIEIQLLVK